MPEIKNIIFDLGGVLLDINYHKTADAFKALGIKDFDALYSQYKINDFFEKFETGDVTDDEFYASVRKYAQLPLTNSEIDDAWNAMLLQFRIPTLDFIKTLRGKYRVYVLSNTNRIHYRAFQKMLQEEIGKDNLDDYFDKSYYSHLIKMRKPYAETYEFVLNDIQALPQETFFIDDTRNNIETADRLGMETHLMIAGELVETLPFFNQ